MFVLFLFLGLKLHSNYNLRTQEKDEGIQDTVSTKNLLKSKLDKFTFKKKEGGRYKCDVIKTNDISEKQILLESDSEYQALIKCDNAKYNPNQNNVEIEGTIMNNVGKHILDQNQEALIIINNADFKCTSSIFRASASTNSDAQIIHFTGEGVHTISNTEFKLCGNNPFRYLRDNEHLLEDYDPTLIVFDDSSKNLITGVHFYNPETENLELMEPYPVRCIRTKKTCSLVVSGTYFYNATAYHRGSFFLLESIGETSILYSQFESCYDRENFAHAIFASQGTVNIRNCNFNNVLMNQSSKGSIVRADTKIFNFEGNNIKFDNPSIKCRCLYLPNSGSFNILQNEFKDFKVNAKGAAIYVEKPSDITFNKNTFDHIIGSETNHALFLNFDVLGDQALEGNKFTNVDSADGFLAIRANELENITFENWKFSNVDQNGGGIINFENDNNQQYQLIFTNCEFVSNTNTDGGSLLINSNTFPSCKSLNLNNCFFLYNSASGRGGAVATYFDGDVIIDKCDFNLNAASDAGAIYIQVNFETTRKCDIKNTNFNEDNGRECHALWVDVVSQTNDDFSVEFDSLNFSNCYGRGYAGGASYLSNCKSTKALNCYFQNFNDEGHRGMQCGGINITAKSSLEVYGCHFIRCSAGSIEGSYGGGIGYKSKDTDVHDVEHIKIQKSEFDSGIGNNGVALLLDVCTSDVFISEVQVKNHFETGYIFCIIFNTELDDHTFTLDDVQFIGNRHLNRNSDEDCGGGSGIYIAEARSNDYLESMTVNFSNCRFEYNSSPKDGGAFGYGITERLKAIELVFYQCLFNHNYCENSGGACHFDTKKTIELYNCQFINNTCQSNKEISGGGALEFTSSVELATINSCLFENCKASKGSFIYTTGYVRGFNVSSCTFSFTNTIEDQHFSSVHLDVHSTARTFIFEQNDFSNLNCYGHYGGSGLHIGTNRDCEITSCTFRGNKGNAQIMVPESSNYKLIFSKCKFSQDQGSRVINVTNEAAIDFDECDFVNFDETTQSMGEGLIGYSIAKNKAIFYNNCFFSNIQSYSVFNFENYEGKVEMNSCSFENVKACQSGKGGFFVISKATGFLLTNCILRESGSPDGVDHPCFDLCSSIIIAEIINCTFQKCGRSANGAAVKTTDQIEEIDVINSTFQENFAMGLAGNTLSVYIKGKSCRISGCKVHTRKVNENKFDIYQFRVFSSNVIFENNLFDKLSPNDVSEDEHYGFGGIYFSEVNTLDMFDNVFTTRNTAVYIANSSQINITNNIWEECYGKSGAGPRAFSIESNLDTLIFQNNIVRNCPNINNNIMTFSAKNIIIKDCQFYQNEYNGATGGGIGMTFGSSNFNVTFINCIFQRNKGNIGGALQFGGCNSRESSNTGSLEMIDCIFEENNAKATGGGLSFTSNKQNIIENCTFTKNTANRKAGSISIISQDTDFIYKTSDEGNSLNFVKNCQFSDNTGNNGCQSIYIMNKGRTFFEDCSFSNFNNPAGTGGQILCQRQAGWQADEGFVEVRRTTFDSNEASSCYGFEVQEYGNSIVHQCTFNNFKQGSLGNAISLNKNGENNEIYENTFNNCGKSGYVVFCNGFGIDFHNNSFIFDDIDNSCGCIKINCDSGNLDHKIYNNHFHDCTVDKSSSTSKGILFYQCSSSGILSVHDNIFENLKGKEAAFSIKANDRINIIFENNLIQNNQPGDSNQYLCSFYFDKQTNNQKLILINNSFINNKCNSAYGGGIGIWITYPEYEFQDCLFEGNTAMYKPDLTAEANKPNGRGGAVQIGMSKSTMNTSPSFIGCQFKNNKAENEGGALSISVTKPVKIENCNFTNNVAGIDVDYVNGTFESGGAIHIETVSDASNIQQIISNSYFTKNRGVDGAAIAIYSNYSIEILVNNNCQFIDNGVLSNENAIVVSATHFNMRDSTIRYSNSNEDTPRGIIINKNAIIENVFFNNVNGNDAINKGNSNCTSIYITSSSEEAIINKCVFTDCAFHHNEHFAPILVESLHTVIIENSVFNYSRSQNCGGAIRINNYCKLTIKNNYFTNTDNEGTICYKPERSDTSDNFVIIEGNIFDAIKSYDSTSIAAYFDFTKESKYASFEFRNNTFENIIDADRVVQIYGVLNDSLIIDQCTFRNIKCHSKYGGGSGFWASDSGRSFDLVFDGCIFENSFAESKDDERSGYGGGLQFGVSPNTISIKLSINNCTFRGNRAEKFGGALALGMGDSFEIYNCIFEDNIGGIATTENNKYYGGAVYIDPQSDLPNEKVITFSKCIFRNNTAPDANAIYTIGCANTDILIQKDTLFEDNRLSGTESQDLSALIIDSKRLIIDSCKFTYKDSGYSSRAIETSSINVTISNSLFNNCANGNRSTAKANAIWVKKEVTSCIIEGCTFTNNGNNRGDVISTETRDFLFENSSISFTNRNTRGIYVLYPCKFYIFNSLISGCLFNTGGLTSAGIEYHGEGIVLQGYSEDIKIEGTTFDSNSGAGTSHLLLHKIQSFPVIYNSTFKGEDKKSFKLTIIFGFLPREEYRIERLIFEYNSFSKGNEVEDRDTDGGGSGIWIAQANDLQTTREPWPLAFEKCIFRNNHAKKSGGAFAYGQSDTLTFISLNFNNCSFIENQCESSNQNGGGGALWFNSQENVNISNCYFTGNIALNQASSQGKGHAIYAAPRSLIHVENCKFVDNGDEGIESVIQISGQQFNLTNSELSFTKSGTACRGIYIDFPGIVNILHTTFTNCGQNKQNLEGGAIYYKTSNQDSVLEEQITVNNCIFDNCLAANGCAILFWASVPPTLIGNQVLNQISGKYIISIFYTSFQDYSIVENMDFIGCTNNAEDGGSSGIWIANNKEISNGRPAELIFRNCKWENNYAQNKGGAIHYGNSETLKFMELTFEGCRFLNNRAKEAGGAVSIATCSPSIFRDCIFNGNIVEKISSTSTTKGSAIYIDSETPLCLVSGCKFTNSTADEGNAIYASKQVLALHITDNTEITNCGSSGSCIVIESKEFFFLDSLIEFDTTNKAARGILVRTLSIIKISDSKFTKCCAPQNGQGGAILIQQNKVENDSQEEVQLLYSTIDGCKADNGCAIMFWILTNPIIRGNSITNHNFNKYIFTIIRTTNFADQFTIENCTFMKNKYSNKQKQDGGGAAIWVANQQSVNEGELSQLIFKDCNWTKNTGVYGGAFSYGKSNTVKFIQLEFQYCHFENNQATGDQGGALHLTTVAPVTITGCTFYNNKCVNNLQNLEGGDQALGGAVYFDTNSTSLIILNTTFRKNSAQNGNGIFVSEKTTRVEIIDSHFISNSNGNVGAQVAHQGAELSATNTNFDYQVVTLHSKGVDILSKSYSEFIDCNFTLCETPYEKGGALFVQDQIINSPNIERLKLDGCIFDNCNSSEGSSIYASLSVLPEITRCTIKNNKQGCSIFVLKFTTKQNQLDLKDCTFQDNEYLNTEEKPDLGGSGISISNVLRITFNNCSFIGNKANYVGGALAYYDNEPDRVFEFNNKCLFEENTCNGQYGGALYLASQNTFIINGCIFRSNRPLSSSIKGGDIYVDSGEVQIDQSEFYSGSSIVDEGNAIYCSSNTNTISISSTLFDNCGTSGTVVVSYAKTNKFSDNNVTFIEATNERSARGLALYMTSASSSSIVQRSTFTNCFFNSQNENIGGGGLYIKCTSDSNSLTLDECHFVGSLANRGGAMYLDLVSQVSLIGVSTSKCESSNNIIYIRYASPVESTSFESCLFENSKLTASNDGGGSGIFISNNNKLSFSGCTFKNNTASGNGGAFAYYNSQEAKNTELEFKGCTFNGNTAKIGGALYMDTEKPILISGNCMFDSNKASDQSGAFYINCKSNIKIELTNVVRNNATSKNAAMYINSAQKLEFSNVTISDNNSPSSPSSVEINNEGTADFANNNFDFSRQSDSQYQISLTGRSSSSVCNFVMNCFTHKGSFANNDKLIHILSTHAGQINIPKGNCFDSNQITSLQHSGGPSSVDSTIFDCKKCGEIYIPTAAPEATPTATRQITAKPTEIPLPTDKPYIPTPVPTPGLPSVPGSSDAISTSSSVDENPSSDSNKGKKKKVNIGMIAGIAAAVVVVIVVVIILLWLFIFRRRGANNNSPQGTMDSNTLGTNETISGVNTTPQDDPIWAGATATHDNPLFNGSEDQDDDQMMHTGFEESWGENVI